MLICRNPEILSFLSTLQLQFMLTSRLVGSQQNQSNIPCLNKTCYLYLLKSFIQSREAPLWMVFVYKFVCVPVCLSKLKCNKSNAAHLCAKCRCQNFPDPTITGISFYWIYQNKISWVCTCVLVRFLVGWFGKTQTKNLMRRNWAAYKTGQFRQNWKIFFRKNYLAIIYNSHICIPKAGREFQ